MVSLLIFIIIPCYACKIHILSYHGDFQESYPSYLYYGFAITIIKFDVIKSLHELQHMYVFLGDKSVIELLITSLRG